MVDVAKTPDGRLYAQTFADRGRALLDVLQDRAAEREAFDAEAGQ